MVLRRQPRPDLIVTEVVLMQESRHPNIVNFVDSFLPRDENLWIVLEYMEGGPLTDVIDNNLMEEDQIAYVCKEVSREYVQKYSCGTYVVLRRLPRDYSSFTSGTLSIATSSPTTCFSMLKPGSRFVRHPFHFGHAVRR